ncbi:protein of unknown function DUF917 [Desulfotomaculum nigrificans CO-1-SRB]|uniref:DUF917 domain-containing protein n=1 Tax=Desulfotomaculum nigrificans (strain DSM 14880 / VKM B-2319 / CO-1-SRB) TaxID=868595 RepID=F6B4V2_DESCC|nr:DUF917 domain-containing protein [Desulfotomaculum nigrificans]AEF95324.1 protein of unknown function DUF917 [Desulfotomaculum nigrificans CO-1-SRB]
MRTLDVQAIEDIALGAAVLGTGGGGDPYVGKLMAIQAIEEFGPIKLLEPNEVPDDALIVPTAMMGAPTVLVEKVPNGEEVIGAFHSLESYLKQPVYATIPIEAGGVNSMIPLALAARLGIPVVDTDGMGRAFPELQMVTFHLHGISATPMVLCDEKGNNIMLNTVDNVWTERLARNATVVMGGSVMLAIYPMTGSQLKQSGIHGIVTLTEKIGRAIRESKSQRLDPVQTVLQVTGGFELFRGKVTDVARKTVGGFARGESKLEGIDGYKGETMTLNFQNEHLIARTEAEVLATTPDLIAVLDVETGRPITTEGLRYGARAVVIGIPCNPQWRTDKGLATVGPRYFGYDLDYIPVEERVRNSKGGQR